jgi:Do/DeqQ family serine protease
MRVAPFALAFSLAVIVLTLQPSMPTHAALPALEGQQRLPTLSPLMEKVTPAVVNIASRSPVEENPLFRDPFFRRFFELPEPQPQMSAGSGVIVDADKGYVLTNHHVIANATEVMVKLKDRRRFKATLVGSDRGTDIALLRIEATNLTALPFGDSDALRVGDFVVAIGNPFGLGQTVTSGIVSALGRSGLNIEGYEDFIQTDASINPGNSGGALVNLKGELVGINTAIIGPTGGNVGIGFAVPSNMARAVTDQLARYGEVRRGQVGVMIQDLTPDIARALNIAQSRGAVITQVQPGSSAEEAGIQAGDVVIELNGRPVRNSSDLRNRIGLVRIGEKVKLTIVRNGKRKTLSMRVAAPKEITAGPGTPMEKLAGAAFQDIQPGMPAYGKVEGVQIVEVEASSPAWRHGLREGDIIVGVNRQRVKNADELRRALQTATDVIALNIIRGNGQMLIVIR